jgi:mRNA interferase RelE/StbE
MAKNASFRWTNWSGILAWRIEVSASAAKQLGRLDKREGKSITHFLRHRLAVQDDPRSIGKALPGPRLGTYWRNRVGHYRLTCQIQDGLLCVLVIEIGNPRDFYR